MPFGRSGGDWRVIDVKKEQLFRREMSLPANGKRKIFLDFELKCANFRAWLMAIINLIHGVSIRARTRTGRATLDA